MYSYSYLFPLSLFGLLYLMAAVGVEGTEDWSAKCPARCKCIWASGRKSVECKDAGYTTIPERLSDEIQALDLSGNRISHLTKHMFKDAGLLNLQRIFLTNCGVEKVDSEAFQDLKIMIELNLSGNNITSIQMEAFSSNERLRELYLNGNPLTKLTGTFPPLQHLKILDLKDCHLSYLPRKSFHLLKNLEQLDLSGNRFENLHEDLLQPLGKLIALPLRNNPWNCDCKLKSFRDWAMTRKLLGGSGTKCAEPRKIFGLEWTVLMSTDFACKPEIVTLQISGRDTDDLIVGDVGKDITLECLVTANPAPSVGWYREGQAVSNASNSVHGKTYLVHISGEYDRWVNLTILKSHPNDAGEYTCVGSNEGGNVERNITLNFQDVPSGAGVGIGVNDGKGIRDQSWLWILLAAIAVFLTVTMVVLVACICSRRRRVKTARSQDLKGGQQHQPLVDHRTEDSSPGDGTKGDGTTPLLTKEFPSGNIKVDGADASDYPDLLNLPNRSQESPAGSSSSTVPDSTRLIMPQQLNPSALYDPAGNQLTLNYRHPGILHHHGMGRPHSPYAVSVASFTSEPQVIMPAGNRPGYVTLPRRPRVPSWSPASHSHYPSVSTPLSPPSPTGSLFSSMGPFIGPKYDNLGPRTTADGSSKLSLNKLGLPGSEPSTPLNSATLPMPVRNRSTILPYHHSPAPHFSFAPIQEHEGPTTPTENNNHSYGLPTPESEPPLSTLPRSWKPNESPKPIKSNFPNSSVSPDKKSDLTSPMSPMSPNSVSGKKVPPPPPPKPKKGNLSKETSLDANNVSTINTIREGDEGTEV